MDQAAILDHQFLIAAYVVTWAIQLGYLAWLWLKWRAQEARREPQRAQSLKRPPRKQPDGIRYCPHAWMLHIASTCGCQRPIEFSV